ncbi:GGDEF domain-containing protein [Rubrivivax gelatinosus]|nr:GGDEF domain-containing protein [Rubrivivax gelatinosus]
MQSAGGKVPRLAPSGKAVKRWLPLALWLCAGLAIAEPRAPVPGALGPDERLLDSLLRADIGRPVEQRLAHIDALRADPRWAGPGWQALLAVERCAAAQDGSAGVLAALESRSGRDADPQTRVAVLKCRQWAADRGGDPSDNYRLAREAWGLLDELKLSSLAFRVARDYADEATYAGALDEALTAVARALEIARGAGDALREADALTTLALIQSELGRHDDALRNSDRALELDPAIERSDDKLLSRSALQIKARRYDAALLTLRRALELAEREGDDESVLAIRINLAAVYHHTGRAAENLVLTAALLPEAQRLDIQYLKPYVYIARAFALADAGQVQAGSEMFERGRDWFERGGEVNLMADSLQDWAGVLARWGRWEQAYAASARAAELHERTQRQAREKNASFLAAVLESGRKDLDIERLRHQGETARLQLEAERLTQRTWVVVGIAVLLSTASLLFVHLRLRRANHQLRAANVALDYESTHDPLTRAYNRRYFERFFEQRRGRGQGRVLLVLLDIDHFKAINDRHGHACGDRVLLESSQRLAHCVRSADRVVRWGGEEFLVFVDEPASAEAERCLVLRLLDTVATTPFELRGVPVDVTVSIGFGSFELAPGFDLDLALADIDAMLYRAKRTGRHRAIGRLHGATEPVLLLPTPPAASVTSLSA